MLSPHRKPYTIPPKSALKSTANTAEMRYKYCRLKNTDTGKCEGLTIVVVDVGSQTNDRVEQNIQQQNNNDNYVAMLLSIFCYKITEEKSPVHDNVSETSTNKSCSKSKQEMSCQNESVHTSSIHPPHVFNTRTDQIFHRLPPRRLPLEERWHSRRFLPPPTEQR